ncbi:MAG: DUF4296 domain-containing protein [Muribaculaceae bacterium]|nr:DUF4296 domain-containing protein [Muribaculaceae bacterium]
MKHLPAIFLIILLSFGCTKRPKDILSEEKMIEVMADLRIAEAYERSGDAYEYLHGQSREMIGRGVLMHHGVSVEVMDSTIAWYGRNMDEYAKLNKKVDAELSKRQIKYAKAAGESENENASTDLWPYSHHFVVDGNSLSDGLIANIPVTELSPGDKITWKMMTRGNSERNLTLGVNYDDGTTEISKINNNSLDKWIEISIHTDTLLNVSRIFAIATFGHSDRRIFVDSVQLLHLPFNRDDYGMNFYQRKIGPAGRKIVLPPDTSTNSNLVPDSIIPIPSSSTANNRGVKTLRNRLK